jgi:predicted 3-demethylubiquinone-9 3-methyltransferase (glyoxalase superfamily)
MKNLIYTCLWFNGNAGEAAKFYTGVFDKSVVVEENQMVSVFETGGQRFICLNGGPDYRINPSISFYIVYDSLQKLNKAWSMLADGGSVLMPIDKYDWSERYGWLQDRYGVSWQLVLGKPEDAGQQISPVLMFTGRQSGNAEKAIRFYTSVFKGSGIVNMFRYEKGENDIEGNLKHAQFRLGKQVFMALDSSLPHDYNFNEAVSFVVDCDNQDQIDYYWSNLTRGGSEGQCGWLKDQFGVSWQVIPAILPKLLADPARSERVTNAFLRMKKFEIEKLVNA